MIVLVVTFVSIYRLKRSEIGHLYLVQADQYTQKRQQNIVKNLTR